MQYCRKCGNKLLEDEEFCSSCGTSVSRSVLRQEDTRRGSNISGQAAKIVAVAIAGVIVMALVIGFLPQLFNAGRQIGENINPTNVAVTSKNIRTGNVGLEYTAWVDVSIHNSGGPGTVVVWAEVIQGSSSWKKSMSVYLEAQGSKDMTFTFGEVSFWTTQTISYRVWVE